jgi:hypothetical protein
MKTTTALKKEIHQAVDFIEDENFLKVINTLLTEKSFEVASGFTPEHIKELEKRRKNYREGKGKSYSVAEAKKIALARIGK